MFEQQLKNYAQLAVEVGLNLRSGQRLVILAPIEAASLVRQLAVQAYQAGARYVDVLWNDQQVTLARFRYAPRDSFKEYSAWVPQALETYLRNGDALLNVYAADPDLLKDQDPELVSTAQKATLQAQEGVSELVANNVTNWCVISMPIPSWSKKVFPDLPPQEQEARLWEAIFKVCRLYQPDPVSAWKEHIHQLADRAGHLNRRGFSALKYTGPGTSLTVGLPPGHRWISGQVTSQNGIPFTANLPTEEIFTLPDRNHVEGVVTASRPLSYANTLIKDFSLTFEGGQVVKAHAEHGEAVLQSLLETDPGACRLGEVALVPHSSPISASGMLFYNTLFDENAASHLALGKAYHFTLQGGEELTSDAFEAAGGNNSLVHVDFMIGSGQMDIDGLRPGGASEPLMRQGEWAFTV